jgi:ABC-type multidrug transport system fused ATPase/permease subunit
VNAAGRRCIGSKRCSKPEPHQRGSERRAPAGLKTGIEFRNVSFAYGHKQNGHAALDGISFNLPVGKSVGLVGRIGAGKSTVAQLVPRLFDVSTGEILLDGQNIRKFSLSELRRMMGYVPQDPFLFSTTLRRNLALGREQYSEEELTARSGSPSSTAISKFFRSAWTQWSVNGV